MKHIFQASAAAATSVTVLTLAAPAAPASAATPLKCRAVMSNSHPKDYTSTGVLVSTVSKARMTTVAHYKTVNRTHRGTASIHGWIDMLYYISGAAPGYKVKVSVYVAKGSRTGSCSTSFTPHR